MGEMSHFEKGRGEGVRGEGMFDATASLFIYFTVRTLES